MQNILKGKNMQKYYVTFLQMYPLKNFFSRYFKKILKFFLLICIHIIKKKSSKNGFCFTWGGGDKNVTQQIDFFTPSLREATKKQTKKGEGY